MPVARETIVDAALEQAERGSWEAVRLHVIASSLGVSLDEIRRHFREKEDIVDAWFDRADAAMVAEAEKPDFLALGARERLERALLAWLDALAPHRRVTRQMILGKLEPGHLHYQVSGLLRVSRTVQWWREAAQRRATLPWRAFEEAALTGIYLMVFAYWMQDASPGSARTRAFLRRQLERAERLSRGRAPRAEQVAAAPPGDRTGTGPAGLDL